MNVLKPLNEQLVGGQTPNVLESVKFQSDFPELALFFFDKEKKNIVFPDFQKGFDRGKLITSFSLAVKDALANGVTKKDVGDVRARVCSLFKLPTDFADLEQEEFETMLEETPLPYEITQRGVSRDDDSNFENEHLEEGEDLGDGEGL